MKRVNGSELRMLGNLRQCSAVIHMVVVDFHLVYLSKWRRALGEN
jgi:hypothetical protein